MVRPDRVLVIDDETALHEMADLLFAGCVIHHARHGQQGLDLLAAHPDVDIIILDLVMPVLDGFGVLTRLAADTRYRRIPVLVCSGSRADTNRALALGARDFVAKPADFAEIELRISSLVDQKRRAEKGDRVKVDFLSAVSHELRTPMNGILGLMEALADTAPTAEQSAYLDALGASAHRMMALVDNVLTFLDSENPLRAVSRVAFSPRELVQNAVRAGMLAAGRTGVTLAAAVTEDVPAQVIGWPDRITLVLGHLIENAVRAMPEGRVTVSVATAPGETREQHLEFAVTDTGPRLPPDTETRLFDPFVVEPGPKGFGGLGLGLAIASRTVQLMGGTLESQTQDGARFRFVLAFPAAMSS